MVVMSKEMEEYFNNLQIKIKECYDLAEEARNKGLDPEIFVESPQAKDLAGRVEKLVGPEGVADVIRNLKGQGKSEDAIVFQVVSDILDKKIGNIENLDDRVERAIRVGLAIKTMGVVSAPLEGISKILIKTDQQGRKYLSLYFAGPIRAAGGTTAGLCVLIADFVRNKSQIPKYEATEGEIGRYVEEVKLYDRRVHLQYPSTNNEIRFAVEHLPVEINGDSTEDVEVSAFRDLPRVETNKIRGGACLVLNDGILLKASKLLKIAKLMNLEGWDWLDGLKKVAHKVNKDDKSTKKKEDNNIKIAPNSKYIADIIAGRPVFSYPSRIGGHRLRYGRSRNTGLAAGGMHPASMVLLDNFIAIGTQLRIERPGKSTSICPVSSIEPPIVKLNNKNVIRVDSATKAEKIFPKVKKILFIGDILFGYGEFSENNHKLIPSGYVEEWWALELEKKMKERGDKKPDLNNYLNDPFENIPTPELAIKLSLEFDIPLHPKYTDFWGNLDIKELEILQEAFKKGYDNKNNVIILKNEKEIKKILEKAFIIHKIDDGNIHFSSDMNKIYITIFSLTDNRHIRIEGKDNVFTYLNKLSSIRIKNKAPYFIGSRMGRPEKSERKTMKGIHTLFPLSDVVGNSRLVEKAMEHTKRLNSDINSGVKYKKNEKNNFEKEKVKTGEIDIDVCRRKCPNCNNITIFNICPKCKYHTELRSICIKCKKTYTKVDPEQKNKCPKCNELLKPSYKAPFNIKTYINAVSKKLKMQIPSNLKGIIGLTNEFKVPEPIEKGILRAKNEVLVYKTAEVRYDATDIPLTHFKPKEIGVSSDKLNELGYTHDYKGNTLTNNEQIIELHVQDILLSDDCAEYFIKVAKFLDDELESFYKMKRYYNVKNRNDLIGHLVVGLAPHTSAGIIGRIIGFSPARSIYAHPYWHAAKRRNCFPGNTEILVSIGGKIRKVTLKELYEVFFDNESFEKMVYIKKTQIHDIKVYSYDKKTGDIITTDINDVIKTPAPKNLITFNLKTGRSFKTTLDHPVIVYSDGEIIEKRAIDVSKKDKFMLANYNFDVLDIELIDLINEFHKKQFRHIWNDLMIRGIRDFVKDLIEKLGLKSTAEKLKINKKTLSNYYIKRDSIPFSILLKLLKIHNLSLKEIPNCTLGFKRDHTTVKRYISVDSSLMKIFGYYLAEGFYRRIPDGYQVDLAVSEINLRNDMMQSIKESFGNGFSPYVNSSRITISNRIIYHLFKDILQFENKARLKHVPSFLLKLPKNKISYLLSAYFSGDGGLDISHNTVNCSSSSLKLIQGIDLLLLRFGIFGGISKYSKDKKLEYKLRIRGVNVYKYKEHIDFTSLRKANILENIVKIKKTREEETYQNHRLLSIRNIEISSTDEEFVYSLDADKYHTIIVNDNIITHQCDGDEDAVMLLLDPLLNFSRNYLPSRIGGRMDATLVISTLLDPNEIDSEAHNVDTLYKYPLEFYEATERYASPNEIEKIMDIVKNRLGTEKQYENIGYNLPTEDINSGPKTTAYKLHESMDEKIEAQLHLARIIKAVDPKNVAIKILSTHFNPDILGNLRKFSIQTFRCVKCNTKYRRPPISNSGKCPKCGNNIILTVNRGGITKYIPRAIKLCEDFKLDDYTHQRMELIKEYVTSLTNNPKIKQQKLSDFF